MPERQKLTDTAGAADYLNLSSSTLTKWRVSGRGPRHIKMGAAVRYDFADLEAFKAKAARESTSEARAA